MNDTHHPPGTVYYSDESVQLYHGDCLDVMASLPDASVDAIVTDPPYGLGFMGKAWDSFASERNEGQRGGTADKGILPGYGRGGTSADRVKYRDSEARAYGTWCEHWAVEALRVLKPGGYLLAFGGTRTWHRLTCAVEDAGFEIRDSIAWLYGSGFPKSLDVSKAIDKAAGAEREITRAASVPDEVRPRASFERERRDIPATDSAKQWQGWGTALKPAFEPVVCARKPLTGTVAANIQQHGVGALNIDGCRIGASERPVMVRTATTVAASSMSGESTGATSSGEVTTLGRWPANVILDESQAAELDTQSGDRPSGGGPSGTYAATGLRGNTYTQTRIARDGDDGGPSRYFPTFRYEAKAPGHERPRDGDTAHPTVKPLDLMRWLVRLVTPPSGTVLDPFLGSGTTAEACIVEGFQCIGIERDETYLPLIVARLSKPIAPVLDFGVGA
jgi:DNA modification methylase